MSSAAADGADGADGADTGAGSCAAELAMGAARGSACATVLPISAAPSNA